MATDDPVQPSQATPGLDPAGLPGGPSVMVTVDGEVFAVRDLGDRGTQYDWLSGPNPGYGFGTSGAAGLTVEQHRAHIRDFLAQIDPSTGFLGED